MAVATRPTPEQALEHWVNANGNAELAAERLFGRDTPNATYQLNALLASDPTTTVALKQAMRAFVLLDSYEVYQAIRSVFMEKASKLDPYEAARAFKGVLEAIQAYTSDNTSTTNINVFETVMAQLPPQVRDALKELSGGNAHADAIEGSWSVVDHDGPDGVDEC